jgi:hypothetical protein
MSKFINPFASLFLSSRPFQLVVVLGVAASVTAALMGSASALPPDPCDIFFGFYAIRSRARLNVHHSGPYRGSAADY